MKLRGILPRRRSRTTSLNKLLNNLKKAFRLRRGIIDQRTASLGEGTEDLDTEIADAIEELEDEDTPPPLPPRPKPSPEAPPAPPAPIAPDTPTEIHVEPHPSFLEEVQQRREELKPVEPASVSQPPYEPDDPMSKKLQYIDEIKHGVQLRPASERILAPKPEEKLSPREALMEEIRQAQVQTMLHAIPREDPVAEPVVPSPVPRVPPAIDENDEWIDDTPLPPKFQDIIMPEQKRPRVEPVFKPEKPQPQGAPVTQDLIESLGKRRLAIEDSDDEDDEEFDDGYGFSHFRKSALEGGRNCYRTDSERNKEIARLRERLSGNALLRALPYNTLKGRKYGQSRIMKYIPKRVRANVPADAQWEAIADMKELPKKVRDLFSLAGIVPRPSKSSSKTASKSASKSASQALIERLARRRRVIEDSDDEDSDEEIPPPLPPRPRPPPLPPRPQPPKAAAAPKKRAANKAGKPKARRNRKPLDDFVVEDNGLEEYLRRMIQHQFRPRLRYEDVEHS